MSEQRFPTAFPLKHQRKDLELALNFAQAHSQEVPVAAATTQLFKKVKPKTPCLERDESHIRNRRDISCAFDMLWDQAWGLPRSDSPSPTAQQVVRHALPNKHLSSCCPLPGITLRAFGCSALHLSLS